MVVMGVPRKLSVPQLASAVARFAVAPSRTQETLPATAQKKRVSAPLGLFRPRSRKTAGPTGPPFGFVLAAALPAVVLLTVAYNMAERDGGLRPFHVFWAGVLCFLVPAAVFLLGSGGRRAERQAVVAALGFFLFLPKLLRSPGRPVYYDELAHWRQSELIHRTGELFQPNPIVHFAQYFPGLHGLTVTLQDVTGLSTLVIATVILAVSHAMALVGVYKLAELISGNGRVAGVAALVYGLNPSFMFFDSQYAYESLSIVFFIWGLVALVAAQQAERLRSQLAWIGVGVLCAVTCTFTHHLTSYFLAGSLATVTVIALFRAAIRRERARTLVPALVLTVTAAASSALWLLIVAPDVVGYLSPKLLGGLTEIDHLLHRSQGSRQLFAQSQTPFYERRAAFLTPALAGFASLFGLISLRGRLRVSSGAAGIALVGLTYFPSIPFILTSAGAEGARRSWAFTSVGLAVLVAAGLVWAMDHVREWRLLGRVAVAGAAGTLAIIAIGNVSMGLNAEYRFPGSFEYGSDARALSQEVLAAKDWFHETQGESHRIVADRDMSLAFGALDFNWIERAWAQNPLWQLYFQIDQPSEPLLNRASLHRHRLRGRRQADDARPAAHRRLHGPGRAAGPQPDEGAAGTCPHEVPARAMDDRAVRQQQHPDLPARHAAGQRLHRPPRATTSPARTARTRRERGPTRPTAGGALPRPRSPCCSCWRRS